MFVPLLFLALQQPAAQQARPDVYNGRAGQTRVNIPRLDTAVVIDGNLGEGVWSRAALLTGFSQYLPVDQQPAADSTEVLVWYSPTAIHFGVRAYAPAGSVNANLSDRDKTQSDDGVEIVLGTFNDGRQAFVFGVSALGVQADGTINESVRAGGRAFESQTGRPSVDLSANFVYESRGRVTDYGYEIEVRIPFKSLRYQSTATQSWGLQLIRRVPSRGHDQTWTDARINAASFLAQSGTLAGLSDLQRGRVVDLTPSVVAFGDGTPNGTSWNYERSGPELGGTARWGITNNLTLNATVNPDFSQVEADVVALQYDPRQAQFYPERRPFFLEGIENFAAPDGLIYTRRMVKPDLATKITGKIGGTNLAVLTALDDRSATLQGDGHPLYAIVRGVRDLGAQSRLGFTLTERQDGGDYNRVAGVDFRGITRNIWTVSGHLAGSESETAGVTTRAPLFSASIDRNGRGYDFTVRATAIHEDFRARAGFIGRTDVADLVVNNRWTFFRTGGALIESWNFGIRGSGTGHYKPLLNGRASQDRKLHFTGGAAIRGGWRVSWGVFFENFGFDSLLYQDYYMERTLANGAKDTVKFTAAGDPRLHNIDLTATIVTPEWNRFSGDFFYIGGKDENFEEWQSGLIHIVTVNARYRPTEQLRLEAQYQHQQYDRWDDRSTVRMRRVPRLKMEYQASRSIFLRLVGQYDMSQQDDLRDDGRTNFPLLERTGANTYRALTGFRSNNVRADWLFSYQPTPGTVVFLGYGSSLEERNAFRFSHLERTRDGFFVKWSQLWRL